MCVLLHGTFFVEFGVPGDDAGDVVGYVAGDVAGYETGDVVGHKC